jgi:hypothetical protein
MKPVDKKELLNTLESKVEGHLSAASKIFQNMTNENLLSPAPDGGWSIAQCLEHLNRYGHYYLPRIKIALENETGANSSTFKSSWLGAYFTRMMDPKKGTRKIKTFQAYNPPRDLIPHAIVCEFIDQQEVLITYLRKAGDVNLNTIMIPISVTKWIKIRLGDVFQFIIAHNERHIIQAMRLVPEG